jgi:DNA-binding Lrp family transcriptional regulator
MSIPRPDATDERILRLLVRNARASWREIGDLVGLSANAVAQRVRRLELQGWIRAYTIVLDPALDQGSSFAIVQLKMTLESDDDEVERAMAAMPQVEEILDLAGPVDYQVRIRYRSQPELAEAVRALRALPGVTRIETRAVLRDVLTR